MDLETVVALEVVLRFASVVAALVATFALGAVYGMREAKRIYNAPRAEARR